MLFHNFCKSFYSFAGKKFSPLELLHFLPASRRVFLPAAAGGGQLVSSDFVSWIYVSDLAK
jgi:hypothetical protein